MAAMRSSVSAIRLSKGLIGLLLLPSLAACSDDAVTADTQSATQAETETGTETETGEDPDETLPPPGPCEPGPSSADMPELSWRAEYIDSDQAELLTAIAVRPTGELVAAGLSDNSLLVVELGTDGMERWRTKLFADVELDVRGLSIDAEGTSYITGTTQGDLDDQGAIGGSDIYVLAVTSDGALDWVRIWGTPEEDFASDLAIAGTGEIYLTGFTEGELFREQAGEGDGFLMRITRGGEFFWGEQWGGAYLEQPRALALNCEGDIIVAGQRYLDPSDSGAIVMRFNDEGMELWLASLQTPADDSFSDVAILDDEIFAVGSAQLEDDWGSSFTGIAASFELGQGARLWGSEFGEPLGHIVPAGDGLVVGYGVTNTMRLNTDGSWGWSTSLPDPGNLVFLRSLARGADGAIYTASRTGTVELDSTIARFRQP